MNAYRHPQSAGILVCGAEHDAGLDGYRQAGPPCRAGIGKVRCPEDQCGDDECGYSVEPFVDHAEKDTSENDFLQNRNQEEKGQEAQLSHEVEIDFLDPVASCKCYDSCNKSEVDDPGQESLSRLGETALHGDIILFPKVCQPVPYPVPQGIESEHTYAAEDCGSRGRPLAGPSCQTGKTLCQGIYDEKKQETAYKARNPEQKLHFPSGN